MAYLLLNPLVLAVYLSSVLLLFVTDINTFQVVITDWKLIISTSEYL